jgi:rifampicin phosphotransferase
MTARTDMRWTLPLDAPEADLESVGGKGASLASLTAANFPVPPGFQITTAAYRRFVVENRLQQEIARELADIDETDPPALQRASAAIQQAFQRGLTPPDTADAIRERYHELGEPEVAVRSSATAEDLPGLSFAGQQETFLNIHGERDLLEAVRRCWASLWTARAIGYRRQMNIPQDDVAMAVIVQEMVPAEVAGVLFTANPATGNRGELIAEATFGLGEALVGGEVTPESYVIERQSLTITSYTPGMFDTGDVSPGAPSESVDGRVRGERALPDALLRELAQLGLRVEQHFGGTPQDIEWAIADGKLWLLQARPITNLPQPESSDLWQPPIPGTTWVRRQVVEHMPEPLSPLFEDLYLNQGLEQSIRGLGEAMGFASLLDRMFDRPFFTTVNGYGYSRANFNITPRTVLPLILASIKGISWVFRDGVENWRQQGVPAYLATLARWQDVDPQAAPDRELLRGVRELAMADALYWFTAAIAIGAAKVSDSILDSFLRWAAPQGNLQSSLFLRGFPSKALEAEAELDAIARRVRASDALRDYVISTPADRLLADLPQTAEGRALQEDLDRYFARHGHQIYNLDFVAPTLVESPLPVLLGLKALIREPGREALGRQANITRERDRVTEETAQSLGPMRRFLFHKILPWSQRFAPYREDALFYVGAAWPMLRRFALELGRRLADAGSLSAAEDVFFFTSGELEEAIDARHAGQKRPDLVALAHERRELRETRKRLHPPAAVPPTARMMMGALDLSNRETQRRNDPNATTLNGFAVSPGRVTAPASVILSPADFGKMEPGTILVCPTTTPAWTPLFAQARGLVTDIGGILAHGSIVAREYGIPAVMGTGNATQRIVNGQEIIVDGSAGTVTLA